MTGPVVSGGIEPAQTLAVAAGWSTDGVGEGSPVSSPSSEPQAATSAIFSAIPRATASRGEDVCQAAVSMCLTGEREVVRDCHQRNKEETARKANPSRLRIK